jgi:transposase
MDDVTRLIALVEMLRADVQRLNARVSELEAENRELKARLGVDSSNSSKPPSSNPPWVKPPSKKKPSGRKAGGQPGHAGKARTHAPQESVDHTVPVRPTTCKKCNAALGQGANTHPGWRHQVVEIPPIQVVITNYEMESCQCGTCGEWTKAGLPTGVPVGVAGPNLSAMVAYLTGRMRISRRYLKEFLGANGVYLSLGTIQAILEETSEALVEPVAEAVAVVQQSESVHCDETGFGRSNDKNRWWLWVASSLTAVAFKLAAGRGRAQLGELIPPDYPGTVHRDRWKPYEVMQCAKHALCHAHLTRNFQGLIDRGGTAKAIGEYLLAENIRMFSLWHLFLKDELDREGLQREMEPIRIGMKGRLEQVLAEKNPDAKARAMARDLLRQWDWLWTFVDSEGAVPTNNEAERALRHAVVWRKGSHGIQSEAGALFVERILTVLGTAAKQGLAILPYLREACLAHLEGRPAPSLFPA